MDSDSIRRMTKSEFTAELQRFRERLEAVQDNCITGREKTVDAHEALAKRVEKLEQLVSRHIQASHVAWQIGEKELASAANAKGAAGKPGLEPPKSIVRIYCADCKHSVQPLDKPRATILMKNQLRCVYAIEYPVDVLRKDELQCGPDAKWFEPRS